jgi:predicted negative regulator of RcsB-dependent stress response
MNDTNPKSSSSALSSNKTRMVLVAAVVVILLMIGIYYWGNVQTRNQLTAQEAQYEQRITSVDAQLQQARGELAEARNRNHLLMARTALYRTAADLDQRNFGTANTRLQEAEAALRQVNASAGGLDAAELDSLRSSIEGMNLNVATNLQDQRNQVLDLASRLDQIAFEGTGTAVAQ